MITIRGSASLWSLKRLFLARPSLLMRGLAPLSPSLVFRLLGRKTMEVEILKEALNLARATSEEARPARGPQIRPGDVELTADIRRLFDQRPTYGYRRIAALLKRERRSAGQDRVNAKRVYRLDRLTREYSIQSERVYNSCARIAPHRTVQFAGVSALLGFREWPPQGADLSGRRNGLCVCTPY